MEAQYLEQRVRSELPQVGANSFETGNLFDDEDEFYGLFTAVPSDHAQEEQ